MSKRRSITIIDIAKELGIAPSTVSRALSGHSKISPETRDKVMAVAKKWNYVPNKIALSLKNQETRTLGLIIPEIVHYFFSNVISGIEEVANKNGYSLLICQSGESLEREIKAVSTLVRQRVDGLIICCSRETEEFDHVEKLPENKGVPVVYFDRVPPNSKHPKIIVDDLMGAKQATAHLIEQGCKNIAHLAGPENLLISRNRLSGYRLALQNAGRQPKTELIKYCKEGTTEVGFAKMNELLNQEVIPDGVFANNDIIALGAMMAIKKKGLKIPEDVAVIGYSNWQLSEFMEPGLSSVNQPGAEMGEQACQCILNYIESDEPVEFFSPIILPSSLVIRGSSLRKRSAQIKVLNAGG